MEAIATLANGFMDLFRAGSETFIAWVTGIIPLVVIMMTAVNSLIKLIGEDRVNGVAEFATKYTITRYTILPVLAVIFLCNPMAYTFGRSTRRLSTTRQSALFTPSRDFSRTPTAANFLFIWELRRALRNLACRSEIWRSDILSLA